MKTISIHALREEGDPCAGGSAARQGKFLSTPSARRATSGWRPRPPWRCNFYPRPPRGGRPFLGLQALAVLDISIHALREEGDRHRARPHRQTRTISIHALREEGDPTTCSSSSVTAANFYPRPPRGGRRRSRSPVWSTLRNFYPRPPRGGRRCQPRPGSRPDQFLSTPSARRATIRLPSAYPPLHISIHALREEGDGCGGGLLADGHGISIHALREEGDVSGVGSYCFTTAFLSTPSARRATTGCRRRLPRS